MDPKAWGNSHSPRFKIERRQMVLITGPDAGRLPAYLEMNLHLGGHRRYLPAKKCFNDFFQCPIRMPPMLVIKKLHNPGFML